MDQEKQAVEHALADLESELRTSFDIHERIAVQHVLERLVDELPRKGWQA